MCNGGEFNKTAKSMYIIHEKGGLYMFELKNGGCKQSTSKMGGVTPPLRVFLAPYLTQSIFKLGPPDLTISPKCNFYKYANC